MMDQETLNFDIIRSIHEEFDYYKDMMTALSGLIRNSSAEIDMSEADRLGLSLLMDYIVEGQDRIFEDGKEQVMKSPKYIIARAEEILSHHHKYNRLLGDVDESCDGLRHVIKVFGEAYPEAPVLLEKFEKIQK